MSNSSDGIYIYISKRKCGLDLLKDNGLSRAKPSKVPMDKNLNFRDDTSKFLHDPLLFRKFIGILIYLNITRHDIVFSIQCLSQFMSKQRELHLKVVFKILSTSSKIQDKRSYITKIVSQLHSVT